MVLQYSLLYGISWQAALRIRYSWPIALRMSYAGTNQLNPIICGLCSSMSVWEYSFKGVSTFVAFKAFHGLSPHSRKSRANLCRGTKSQQYSEEILCSWLCVRFAHECGESIREIRRNQSKIMSSE